MRAAARRRRLRTLCLALAACAASCGPPHEAPEGAQLYARAGCGLCHGPQGRGDGPHVTIGRVERVDLSDVKAFHYGRSPEAIANLIAVGSASKRGVMPPHQHLTEGERRTLAAYVLQLAPSSSGAEVPRASPIEVRDPWARLAPPSSRTSAAFLVLENRGSETDALLGASCDCARAVELHVMTEADGTMTMRQVDRLDVAPGERLALAPGGTHLMLIDLAAPLAVDRPLDLRLRFERAGEIEISVPVRDLRAADAP